MRTRWCANSLTITTQESTSKARHKKKKKDETHFPIETRARVNALIPFCRSAISVPQQHFIAASSLTAGTVTRSALQVRQSGRYGFLRVAARRGRKGRDTATDSAQQVAPLPRAFLSPGSCPGLSSLPLFVAPVGRSHPLLVQPFDAAFVRPASSTFVNVVGPFFRPSCRSHFQAPNNAVLNRRRNLQFSLYNSPFRQINRLAGIVIMIRCVSRAVISNILLRSRTP